MPLATLPSFPFTSRAAARPAPDPPPPLDDRALIARVLAGERESFHVLLQRHTAPILASLQGLLRQREDAREVLQETWLRAWADLARLREPERLRAWLLSIALNLARARRRRGLERTGEADALEPAAGAREVERDREQPGAQPLLSLIHI